MAKATGWRRAGIGRRREVERRLAALGLAERFPQAVWETSEPPVRRLCAVLPELGLVFSAFGRYLSSRPDLLPEADCQELAAVAGGVLPLEPGKVHGLLFQELGRPPEEVFASFETQPLAANLILQDHRAQLVGGEAVVVRLARPDAPELIARDLDLLPLLAAAFTPEGGACTWMAGAVEDFAGTLAAAADLARQASALVALAQDGASAGLGLCAPRLLPALSTPGVLVFEDLQGLAVDTLVPAELPTAPGMDELAARLCHVWLHQACFGQTFPSDFAGGDLRILPNGGMAWTGTVFATLPAGAKENLWEYLLATLAHDPERACAALSREMDGGPVDDPKRLQNRLRQLVPFRDGGWGARDDFAGYLFLHWRSATAEGYRPRPYLLPFYRGVARLAAQIRPLAPAADPLRDGLERARLAAGLGDMLRLLDRREMKDLLGTYAGAFLAMPQRLNELMTLLSEGRASLKIEVIEPPHERRRKDDSTASLVALLAIVAVVLLARHLTSASAFGPWVERIAAVLLAALGIFLFRGRRRKS
jgi:ubiquinone biosynthesis protein